MGDCTAAKKGRGGGSNVLGVWIAYLCHTHQGLKVTFPLSVIGILNSHCPHQVSLILHQDLTTLGPSILSLMGER